MSQYLLTIDAGTGSGRAVLFDLNGNEIAIGQEEWTHSCEAAVPNSMGFDWEAGWALICRCVRQAIQTAGIDPGSIIGISATSMREGIVLYDGDGRELWAVANVDARADREVKALKASEAGIEEDFYRESGQTFALGALPRLLWVKNNRPELYAKAARISMISDWVLAKLSGVIATDPSNAGTTGIFSLEQRNWRPEMARRCGLRDDIFPEVFEPGVRIGEVSATAAAVTGLAAGTAVVMGGGDVQLGCAGLGVVNRGDAAVLGGTFWQQVVNIDAAVVPPSDMGIRVNPHVITGQSQAEGITFFSGLVMRWFRDVFCVEEKAEGARRGVDTYRVLEEMAAQVPVGSHGIMPIFSDAMSYGKWYHASPSFINLSIDPAVCNKASMFRSLQENACIVSAINLERISAFSGINNDTLVFAGGASKGFLWPQMLADVTGRRVKIPKVREATALGCAMAAGVGAGVYDSLAQAAGALVVWEQEFQPDRDNFARYAEIKQQWQQIYLKQLALVDEGLTTPMWKAPGL
ncbi:MAG: autoinducer-2 kinase [Motiliproteus sp.]